jgi:hypothetical protein
MKNSFNREYWLSQLKKEVGLENVSYEELHLHTVDFGGFFNTNETSKKTAKQYIDEQLVDIEQSYKNLEMPEIVEESPLTLPLPNMESITQIITQITDKGTYSHNNIPVEMLEGVPQLKMVNQSIKRSNIRYFSVTINKQEFIVAINYNADDFRSIDQINHLINTTFFIEELNPLVMNGSENHIISYYQFVNAIQPFLKQTTDLSAYEKISSGTTTVFDGLKLDQF